MRCTNTYLVRNAVVALIQRTRTSCQLILRGCVCPTHSDHTGSLASNFASFGLDSGGLSSIPLKRWNSSSPRRRKQRSSEIASASRYAAPSVFIVPSFSEALEATSCICSMHSDHTTILCAKPPRCQQISAPLVQLAAVITPEPVRPLETLVPLVVWASGKASRTRIRDRPIMSRLLYRLSYSPAVPLPRATLGITALRGYRFANIYRPKIPTHVASICLHLSFAHE